MLPWGPSMEPWGRPASILAQGEACPFKMALCFLEQTESVIIFKIVSDIAFCFNLNNLCAKPYLMMSIYLNIQL